MLATPFASVLPSLNCALAPLIWKTTGVPVGTVLFVKVAAKVWDVPCAGLGDTVGGESTSAGTGLLGTKPHAPDEGASFRIVSSELAYRQPSGPMVPVAIAPFASTVVVNGLVVMSTSLSALLLCTSRDFTAPLGSTSPMVIQKSELMPVNVVIVGEGLFVPAIWITFPAPL